jgi:hypothetical protein
VARSGYRFVAPVRRVDDPDDDSPALSSVVRPVELYESVGRGRSHLLSGSYFDLPHAVDAFRAAIEIITIVLISAESRMQVVDSKRRDVRVV